MYPISRFVGFAVTMTFLYATATAKGYATAWRAMQEYLAIPGPDGHGSLRDVWSPLSPNDAVDDLFWCGFLCHLHFGRVVLWETARKYCVGVKATLATAGVHVDLTKFAVTCAFRKAWRREEAGHKGPPKPKSKLSIEQLHAIMKNSLVPDCVKALIFFGFCALARMGELVGADGIRWEDVTLGPKVVRIFLRASKTDPFRQGSYLVVKRADWDKCVSLLGGEQKSGVIFQMSRAQAVKWMPTQGHSLRRGGAQHLWNEGASLESIKRRGRWSSDAWRAYIDTSVRDLTEQDL